MAGFFGCFVFWLERWIDGWGHRSAGHVGMRVSKCSRWLHRFVPLTLARIVEYATRDQAQSAVNTLSNQNLMGRLVYVREVGSCIRGVIPRCLLFPQCCTTVAEHSQLILPCSHRTVRPNLDSPALLLLVAVTKVGHPEVDMAGVTVAEATVLPRLGRATDLRQ